MSAPGIVGVYAALPTDAVGRRRLTSAVLGLPGCDGLEIPFGSAGYEQDRGWLWDAVAPGGAHVVTLVAATMEALGVDPDFGPASGSERGRAASLDLLRAARDEVARVSASGHRIIAVELQSAPRGTAQPTPDAAAFGGTLAEAASWDWCGAKLVIEHCDAYRPGQPHAKGFLSLADEIAVARDVTTNEATSVGVVINWGRSAIDLRSAEGPVEQITQARDAGVLRGLMLSGTADVEGPFGPAWSDSHAPMQADDPGVGEPTSLLTPELMRRCLLYTSPSPRD